MNSASHLAWPFFDAQHRDFKAQLQTWTQKQFGNMHGHDESRDAIDKECVSLVKALGQGGWLKPAIAGKAHGGKAELLICSPQATIRSCMNCGTTSVPMGKTYLPAGLMG